MAAVIAPAASHSSSHLFPPHHHNFTAFHPYHHPRGPALSPHNPFEAFAPHHHSSAHSRSAAASWRHSEPAPLPSVPSRTPSPKNRRAGPSHSRIHSASSEGSTTSLRLHPPAPAATKVDEARESDVSSNPHSKVSTPFVYSVAELLRLSASPLVGISKESQIIVDNLVAHHVWRRGPQSGATSRRNYRSSSRSCLVHTSTDDSEHSD